MGRQSCNMKQKVRKGLWSPEEDEKLYNFITRFGVGCWSSVPKLAGLQRCGKSCRLRWMNYLRPDLKRGMFTQDEEDLIINLHEALGNRWSQIASQLPGRTDNEIKNLWNSSLKKKLTKHGIDPNTHTPITQTQQDSNSPIQQQVYDHPLFFTQSQENTNTDPDGYDSTLQPRFLHNSNIRINPSCGFVSSVPNLTSFNHQKMIEADYCDSHSCSSSQINTYVINESSSNSAFSWDVENKLESYFSSGIQIEERKTNQWEESSGDFGSYPLTSLSEEFFSADRNYKEL